MDPKLQDAYNKVMGTQVPPATPSDTTSLATPPQTTPDIPMSVSPTMPADMTPPAMSSTPLPTPTEPPAPVNASPMETVSVGNTPTISYDNVTPTQGFSADKKKMKISPVILVIGGIVFLIVYSLVWIKVFNLQVPYINP